MIITDSQATSTWSVAQAAARSFTRSSNPMHMLGGALALADLAVVLTASVGAYTLRQRDLSVSYEMALVTLLAAVLTVNAMWLAGSYSHYSTSSPAVQVGRALQGWSGVCGLLLILGYVSKTSEDFSRSWAFGWYVTVLFGLAVVRVSAARQVHHWRRTGKLTRTVAIVSMEGSSDYIAQRLSNAEAGEFRLLGVFQPQATSKGRNGLGDLIALSRLFRIDDVIVAVSGSRDAKVEAVVRTLGTIPTNVHLCPDMPVLHVAATKAEFVFGQAMLTVSSRPFVGWSRVLKRSEDVILSVIALTLLTPIMIAIAAAIKIETPGPVLFRQKRLGFNNDIITVYKFRSMAHTVTPEVDVPQARRNDPRVTQVGRFIRRSSLDELPQLFNVLQDRMSLVGPRPHALPHNDHYGALIDGYLGRHRVQPGITGWAQVHGLRGETDTLEKMQRRVEYDLAYIDGWSLYLDIRIIVMTVMLALFDRNAY